VKRESIRAVGLVACLVTCLLALASSASADKEFDKYAIESVSASLSNKQAGAHADLTVGFELSATEEVPPKPYAFTRDVEVNLPPGMIGNPQSFPRCTLEQLGEEPEESKCPQDAQVGIAEVTVSGSSEGTLIEPIYNMTSPGGEVVARLGFFAAPYPTLINVEVDPDDYSLVAKVEGAAAAAEMIATNTILWGVPAAEVHDEFRLTPQEAMEEKLPPGGRESGQPEIPFLSNPTDCTLQREVSITASSYQRPDVKVSKSAPFPQVSGCEKLVFKPTFTARPTNPEAFAPTGLDAVLTIPQDETPKGLATSTMKSAVVSLPQGMGINPAAGDGLEACSADEVGFGTTNQSNCPNAAKIGSAEFEVPALEQTLHGSVYQRTPEPGKLFRFWLVTDEQGVHLKLPAEIATNPLTGQVTTVFNGIDSLGGLPQVPVEEIRLHVFGGPRAPLATPGCGTYQTRYEFAPWSGKPATVGDTPMSITSGCSKGGFAPKFEAGTMNSRAGSFAPFTMTLTRQDGEANPQSLSMHLPQGLLAKLAGVPLCGDGEAAPPAPRSAPSPPPQEWAEPPSGSPSPARPPPPSTWQAPTNPPPTASWSGSQPRPAPSTSAPSSPGRRSTSTPTPPPRRSQPTPCRRSSRACRSPTGRSTPWWTGLNSS
jgi:hypothetical protein